MFVNEECPYRISTFNLYREEQAAGGGGGGGYQRGIRVKVGIRVRA